MKPLPELQRNTDNRFTYFMCKSDENQIDQTWGKKQPETTEVDLILVVLTLSGCVTAVGALAFSHYEGKLPRKCCCSACVDTGALNWNLKILVSYTFAALLMGLITNFTELIFCLTQFWTQISAGSPLQFEDFSGDLENRKIISYHMELWQFFNTFDAFKFVIFVQ